MKVPLRGSDVRRKFIGDEFQGRVVREVEGAALEMRFASNRRNVGSNPMLSAHFLIKNSGLSPARCCFYMSMTSPVISTPIRHVTLFAEITAPMLTGIVCSVSIRTASMIRIAVFGG